MTAVPLGPGGEFDRVRAIATALGPVMGRVGDDTARIPDGDGALVVSVDASVEDIHFRRAWLTLEEIGWRATATALSDLAAAAATPVGIVVAVVVPPGAGEVELVNLMRGVGAATSFAGTQLLGGDLTSGRDWAVAVTVFGRVLQAMSRRGAVTGDGVWMTGRLGGARAALHAWTTGAEPDAPARAAFVHPVPRIDAGKWPAAHGATAMIDVSDGLGSDAEHLAAASGVQLQLDLGQLLLHSSVTNAAQRAGEGAAPFAATGGEDYELLVTLPADFAGADAFTAATGLPLTRIGTVMAGTGVRATLDGVVQVIGGFRHAI